MLKVITELEDIKDCMRLMSAYKGSRSHREILEFASRKKSWRFMNGTIRGAWVKLVFTSERGVVTITNTTKNPVLNVVLRDRRGALIQQIRFTGAFEKPAAIEIYNPVTGLLGFKLNISTREAVRRLLA